MILRGDPTLKSLTKNEVRDFFVRINKNIELSFFI